MNTQANINTPREKAALEELNGIIINTKSRYLGAIQNYRSHVDGLIGHGVSCSATPPTAVNENHNGLAGELLRNITELHDLCEEFDSLNSRFSTAVCPVE